MWKAPGRKRLVDRTRRVHYEGHSNTVTHTLVRGHGGIRGEVCTGGRTDRSLELARIRDLPSDPGAQSTGRTLHARIPAVRSGRGSKSPDEPGLPQLAGRIRVAQAGNGSGGHSDSSSQSSS